MLTKRQLAIDVLQKYELILQCPICQATMHVTPTGQVECEARHSFDIAKQGYVNFMTKPVQTMYSKELFEARYEVIASGLYNQVQQEIANLLETGFMLDTGCGEGSHLARIIALRPDVFGVGIDISKEAIICAAKYHSGFSWCVGDLASSPFATASFQTILNFLSPANYDEFKRLLKPNGQVIKVVPEEGYLQELRQQAFAYTEKERYSNEQTVRRFEENFSVTTKKRVTYTVPLTKALSEKLLLMTPMGWHVEHKEDVHLSMITIDVTILIGRV